MTGTHSGARWLRKYVRVFSGVDHAKERGPIAEGQVIAYIDGPSIIVRDAEGRDTAWPITLPMDVQHEHQWQDVTRFADTKQHEVCTLPDCGEQRWVER